MRFIAYAIILAGGLVYMRSPEAQSLAASTLSWLPSGRHDEAMLIVFAVLVWGVASSFVQHNTHLDLSRIKEEDLERMRAALSKLPGPESALAVAKAQSLMNAIAAIDTGAATVQRAASAVVSAGRAVQSLDADELRSSIAQVREAVTLLLTMSDVKVDPGAAAKIDMLKNQLDKVKEIADEYDLDEISGQIESIVSIRGDLEKLSEARA